MREMQEVYLDALYDDGDWMGVWDYRPMLDSLGHTIVVQVADGDYQGDTRILFQDGERYGLLIFGWGSCSGCDALQACGSYKELEELRQHLIDQTFWETKEGMLQYIEERDWRGQWSWGRDTRYFVWKAKRYLRDKA